MDVIVINWKFSSFSYVENLESITNTEFVLNFVKYDRHQELSLKEF